MSTVLPGRTAQWAALGEQLDLLRRGTGGVALLDGPPGCGRTALLDAVTARAAATGTTVLRATASAAERPVPFGVAAQLCGRPLPDPGPDQAARALRVEELGAALPPGPVLVAVDDAGETDDASLGLLCWIARRTGPGRPVLLLVAAPGAALAHDLRRCPAAREHVVGPLDADAVAEVCRARPGPGPEAVLAATGGHPGLVAALLTDHAAGRTTVPGPALVRAVEVLVARLPEGAPRLALALAVTGRRTAPPATGAVPGPA
ncbi:ATP-binding protein, partial [Pseudonocardia sp. Ae406_Ps2]